MNPLQQTLQGALDADRLPPFQPGEFAVDGVEPQVVVCPGSARETARLIEWSAQHGHAVLPRGGGTALGIGNVPPRHDIALDLRQMNQWIEHQPEDMTVTVEAGVTLGHLQELLAAQGQWLPVEAPAAATVGGLIASNPHGPSRLMYGTIRDWLLGIEFVRGDGRLVRGGGKVVKNVAGYDLCRLLVGSFGTLGVITEATFKVAPLPEERVVLRVSPAMREPLASAGWRPQFVEWLSDGAAAAFGVGAEGECLLVGLAGSREEVDWQKAQVGGERVEFDPGRWFSWGASAGVVVRVVTKSSELPRLIARIRGESRPGSFWIADALLGLVRCALEPSPAATGWIRNLRREFAVVIERAPRPIKEALDVWGEAGPSLRLMKAIKAELDPHGILNPGRFVGGI